MIQHTPSETEPGVYRCPCGFHAVATQQGMHVIDSGAGRQLHLAAIAQAQVERAAYAEQVRLGLLKRAVGCDARMVNRLVKHIYAEYGL